MLLDGCEAWTTMLANRFVEIAICVQVTLLQNFQLVDTLLVNIRILDKPLYRDMRVWHGSKDSIVAPLGREASRRPDILYACLVKISIDSEPFGRTRLHICSFRRWFLAWRHDRRGYVAFKCHWSIERHCGLNGLLYHRHYIFILASVKKIHGEPIPEFVLWWHILLVKHARLTTHSISRPLVLFMTEYVL